MLEFNFRVRISRAVIISVLLYLYIVDQLLARNLFSPPHDTFAPRGLRFSWDFVAFCVMSDGWHIVRPQVIKGLVYIYMVFFLIENTFCNTVHIRVKKSFVIFFDDKSWEVLYDFFHGWNFFYCFTELLSYTSFLFVLQGICYNVIMLHIYKYI